MGRTGRIIDSRLEHRFRGIRRRSRCIAAIEVHHFASFALSRSHDDVIIVREAQIRNRRPANASMRAAG
jgi:hypothetical protein